MRYGEIGGGARGIPHQHVRYGEMGVGGRGVPHHHVRYGEMGGGGASPVSMYDMGNWPWWWVGVPRQHETQRLRITYMYSHRALKQNTTKIINDHLTWSLKKKTIATIDSVQKFWIKPIDSDVKCRPKHHPSAGQRFQ